VTYRNRTLVLPSGAKWIYRIGQDTTVLIGPDGQRHNVANSTIKGTTPTIFGRGQAKQTSDGMIYPSEIRRWIETLDKSAGNS
jgi:hypothetical protein